ncbi:MAG TPA: hypothetical protein VJ890_11175 [Vineibacter sp.]|nr:hypothetical protein [Vineibacter sp.]
MKGTASRRAEAVASRGLADKAATWLMRGAAAGVRIEAANREEKAMPDTTPLTVAHLRALRARLVERRWREAYAAADIRLEDTSLDGLIQTSQAIAALDAVIAESRDAPPSEPDDDWADPHPPAAGG